MSVGRILKYMLHMADKYAEAKATGRKPEDVKHLRNKLGASLRLLLEEREQLKIEDDMKKRIKRPELSNFQDVILRSDLDIHIPTVKELPPEEIYALWEKMPNTTLSKEKIFCGAIALFIDHIAKEAKK